MLPDTPASRRVVACCRVTTLRLGLSIADRVPARCPCALPHGCSSCPRVRCWCDELSCVSLRERRARRLLLRSEPTRSNETNRMAAEPNHSVRWVAGLDHCTHVHRTACCVCVRDVCMQCCVALPAILDPLLTERRLNHPSAPRLSRSKGPCAALGQRVPQRGGERSKHCMKIDI